MNCDQALETISAAFDGELTDDDGETRSLLDEHLADCADCTELQTYSIELRARLRFEAVDVTPDVAPSVIARLTASDDAEAGSDTGAETGSADDSPTRTGDADVASLPLWRRARTVLRGSTATNGAGTEHPTEASSLVAAVAAAALVGVILGAAFVGVGHDANSPAWAEELPEQVVEAQHDITSLDADIVVSEKGRPDHDGTRTFEGHLSYEAPERLALELAEDRPAAGRSDDDRDAGDEVEGEDEGPGGGDALQAGEGDVELLVRDDRWWLSTIRSCAAFAGETSCPPEGSAWTREVTGREAFSDAAPIPLELIGPVDSFTLAATPPVLGERTIAERTAVGVRVSAAQVSQFLAALSPGDDLRAVHPSDPVDVWLDREDLVPLAVDVQAARSDERAAWAATHGYSEDPGDTVLSFLVADISVNQGVPDGAFDWPEDEAVTDDSSEASTGGSGGDASDGSDEAVVETTTTIAEPALADDAAGSDEDGVPDAQDGSSLTSESVTGDEGDTAPATDPPATTTTTAPASDLHSRSASGAALVDGVTGALGLGGGAPSATTSTTTSSPGSTASLPSRPTTTTTTTSTTLPPEEATTTTTEIDDDLLGDDDLVDTENPLEEDVEAIEPGAVVEVPQDDDPAGTTVEAGEPVVVDNRTIRDDGFRAGDADLAPEPSALPDGMEPHLEGTTQAGDGPEIGVRSWTDGRAWVKVRATDSWEGPRLFGDLGSTVRSIDLGDAGQGYVSADGRKVALHTDDLDVVLCGSLPIDQLVEMASSLGIEGEAVPGSWSESTTATLGEARAEQPGLLVPEGLEGFGPPAVGITSGTITQLYVGPGDRAFSLTRSDTPNLAPPSGDDSMGVDVRGTAGRYSVSRGELEWTEDGASYSLQSPSVPLSELLSIADALAAGADSAGAGAATPGS